MRNNFLSDAEIAVVATPRCTAIALRYFNLNFSKEVRQ